MISIAGLWSVGPGGRWPEQLSSQLSSQRGEPMVGWPRRSVARAAVLPAVLPRGEPKVFFSPNSLPVGGFSRVSSEPAIVFAGHRPRKPDVYRLVSKTMKDPPTQAVENTTP